MLGQFLASLYQGYQNLPAQTPVTGLTQPAAALRLAVTALRDLESLREAVPRPFQVAVMGPTQEFAAEFASREARPITRLLDSIAGQSPETKANRPSPEAATASGTAAEREAAALWDDGHTAAWPRRSTPWKSHCATTG